MNWIEIKNTQSISLSEIPHLYLDDIRSQVIEKIKSGQRLVQFFADAGENETILYCIIADDNNSRLSVACSKIRSRSTYRSWTPEVPSAAFFERELFEQTGIVPEGHPWLKPLRTGIAGIDQHRG